MRIEFLAAAAGLSILASAPAHAISQSSPSEATSADDVDSATRVICRRVPAPTGSRIGARNICKTQLQWSQIEDETAGTLENMGNRNRFGNEGINSQSGCGRFGNGC